MWSDNFKYLIFDSILLLLHYNVLFMLAHIVTNVGTYVLFEVMLNKNNLRMKSYSLPFIKEQCTPLVNYPVKQNTNDFCIIIFSIPFSKCQQRSKYYNHSLAKSRITVSITLEQIGVWLHTWHLVSSEKQTTASLACWQLLNSVGTVQWCEAVSLSRDSLRPTRPSELECRTGKLLFTHRCPLRWRHAAQNDYQFL